MDPRFWIDIVILSLFEGFVCLWYSCSPCTVKVIIWTVIFAHGKEMVIGGLNSVFHDLLEIFFFFFGSSFPQILLIF